MHLRARPRGNQGQLPGTAADVKELGSWSKAEPAEKLLRVFLHVAGKTIVISDHPRIPQASLELLELSSCQRFFRSCHHSGGLLRFQSLSVALLVIQV